MMILPALLGFAVNVLNGEFRLQAQASQTMRAVLLYPDGLFPIYKPYKHVNELKSPAGKVKKVS